MALVPGAIVFWKKRRLKMNKRFAMRTVLLSLAFIIVGSVMVCATIMGRGASADGTTSSTVFGQFVVDGGVIVWVVLLPLSMVTAFVALECAMSIRRKRLLPSGVGRRLAEMIRRGAAGPLETQLRDSRDMVSVAASDAVVRSRGDLGKMETLFEESLAEQGGRLFRKIEWLNLIGNVAPMVGLLGTVLGMIKLFNAVVLAGGDPLPAQFADGISTALVTTFWGLLIAIPALSVHGVLRNRIETLINDAVTEIEAVLAEVARNRQQTAPATAVAMGNKATRPGIQEVRPTRTKVVRQPSSEKST